MIRGATAQGWCPSAPIAETEPQILAQDHPRPRHRIVKQEAKRQDFACYCSFEYSALACFRNLGIGVCPEGEEIPCRRRAPGRRHPLLRGFRLQSIGTRRSQIRQRSRSAVPDDVAVVRFEKDERHPRLWNRRFNSVDLKLFLSGSGALAVCRCQR